MTTTVAEIPSAPRTWSGSSLGQGTRSYAIQRLMSLALVPIIFYFSARNAIGTIVVALIGLGFAINLLVRFNAARKLYESGTLINATCKSYFAITTARYGVFSFTRHDGVACQARMLSYGPLVVGKEYACLRSDAVPQWVGLVTRGKGIMVGSVKPSRS